MGGDGGSVPTRADMVRTKGFKFARNLGGMGYTPNTQVRGCDERFSRNVSRDLQMSTCALSQEKLRHPIVACRLGKLYNKESIISALLDKKIPLHAQHISSLKDVKDVKAEVNSKTGFLVCPITGLDIRSGSKGSLIWACGCVASNKAIIATASNSPAAEETSDGHHGMRLCMVCGAEYGHNEIIAIAPDDVEMERLKTLVHCKSKKVKRRREMIQSSENSGGEPRAATEHAEPTSTAVPLKTGIKRRRSEIIHSSRAKDWVLLDSVADDSAQSPRKVPKR